MKSIYLSLFLLVPSFFFAQENLNRTWFLEELIIAGNSIEIPNEEAQDGYPTLSILINDTEGQVEGTGICNGFLSSMPISATDAMITLDISPTLVICETQEEIDFEFAYFNFLGAPESESFSYSINEDSLAFTQLTLIKSNGDQAIYGTINSNVPSDISQEGWYLDYYEIGGVAQNPPTDQDNQLNDFTTSLFNDSNEVQQEFVCLFSGNGVFSTFNYFGVPTISISFLATLAEECINPILADYDYIFLMQLEGKTHSYEIVEEGQGRRLILTDSNGDRIFYTNAFLNTEEFDNAVTVKLFPNPTQNNITITGENTEDIQSYQILDTKGSLIASDIFNVIIDVKSLSKGLYFIRLLGNQTETVRRFIKN